MTAPKKTNLAIGRLKEFLEYNPETGAFRWLKSRQGTPFNRVPGNLSQGGIPYVRISIFGESYLAHRLAWFWMTGKWPNEIDHINGNKTDNRWANLRLATRSQNLVNRAPRRNGLKGVYFHKTRKKWYARTNKNGNPIYLGCYPTEALAHEAYKAGAIKHHGKFARFK